MAKQYIYQFADLDGMIYDDLLATKEENLEMLNDCKRQEQEALVHQRETGEYADANWWKRLHSAIHFYGLRDQAIAMRIGRLKRQHGKKTEAEKAHSASTRPERIQSLLQHFTDVAQEELPPKQFSSFMEEAKLRYSTVEDRKD